MAARLFLSFLRQHNVVGPADGAVCRGNGGPADKWARHGHPRDRDLPGGVADARGALLRAVCNQVQHAAGNSASPRRVHQSTRAVVRPAEFPVSSLSRIPPSSCSRSPGDLPAARAASPTTTQRPPPRGPCRAIKQRCVRCRVPFAGRGLCLVRRDASRQLESDATCGSIKKLDS